MPWRRAGSWRQRERRCLLLPGDLADAGYCEAIVAKTVATFGKLAMLVSNAAQRNRKESPDDVTDEAFERTFETNVYACFRLSRAAHGPMQPGAAVIASSSETGIISALMLPDYSATKGAINAFTKAFGRQLVERGNRTQAVAPGPAWTPLDPSDAGMTPERVATFGQKNPMGPAQPEELAPAYVFLASDAGSSCNTGAVLQVTGGETTRG